MKNIKTYEEYEGISFKHYLRKVFDNPISTTILNCHDMDIMDLDGIDQFTNLLEFRCYGNNLSSLKGVENLTDLKDLDCSYNRITSLKGIENLTDLYNLTFNDNKITSLKEVENLTKLDLLYCWNNPIDLVDYIDKQGRTYYVKLPKSIRIFSSNTFESIDQYWEFMDKNQPASISRKFNF